MKGIPCKRLAWLEANSWGLFASGKHGDRIAAFAVVAKPPNPNRMESSCQELHAGHSTRYFTWDADLLLRGTEDVVQVQSTLLGTPTPSHGSICAEAEMRKWLRIPPRALSLLLPSSQTKPTSGEYNCAPGQNRIGMRRTVGI